MAVSRNEPTARSRWPSASKSPSAREAWFVAPELPLSLRGVVAGLAFSALTHGLLDRRWPVRALLRAVGSPRFAETVAPICGIYAADQALHKLALLVSALLIATL